MKYLTLFETTTAYNAATLDLPNVSLVEETMSVDFKPYIPPETKVVVKYNVNYTNDPTTLRTSYEQNIFKSMEIDGVILDELVTAYKFDTTGEHIVKYELYDETKLGNNAPVFYTSNLIECIIPDSVTTICANAFASCSSLTSITIPDSVTSIGGGAFGGCSSLTSITIPDNVTSISDSAFNGCSGLTSINVNNGNTVYDSRDNCNAIIETSTNTLIKCCKTTIIPSSVTSIGQNAFNSCNGLTSIIIPDNITSIGNGAFAGCSSLTSITVNTNNTVYDSRNNCNAIIETTTNTLIQGCKTTIIPDSVIRIDNYAFSRCTGLTSINIPDSITSIGNYAFSGCSSLTSITIPDNVTSIGDSAFYNCIYLTSIDIPSGVTSIGANAFYDCKKLTSITSLATTAPTIQNNTFRSVKTGGTLTVPSGSSGYDVWMGTGNYYLGKYNWTKVEQ